MRDDKVIRMQTAVMLRAGESGMALGLSIEVILEMQQVESRDQEDEKQR